MPGSGDRGGRTLVTLAAGVVVVAGLKAAASIALPFLFAVFLTVLATPPLLWIERRGIPPVLAVIPVVLVLLGALALFGALLTASLDRFADTLPAYRAALEAMFLDSLQWLRRHGVGVPLSGYAESFDPADVVDMVGTLAGATVAALSNTALVLLTTLFMLLEVAGFPRKVRVAMGRPEAEFAAGRTMLVDVQRYLAIKTGISLLTGVAVALLCLLVGLDFPLLWGLVAFLCNYVPNIGGFVAAVPTLLVALVQPGLGTGAMFVIGLGHALIHTVIGNIVEPAWMGRKLGLSPLVVLLCLVFWGWLWGPVGMLLSVPLTMAVKIALESDESLQWIAVLLGPTPPEPKLQPRSRS
ncbi:MAG: AI-2E family transporter [Nannocystaceae bacterium]